LTIKSMRHGRMVWRSDFRQSVKEECETNPQHLDITHKVLWHAECTDGDRQTKGGCEG
jgi:hypothetical protein